jgi:hypothetical protein
MRQGLPSGDISGLFLNLIAVRSEINIAICNIDRGNHIEHEPAPWNAWVRGLASAFKRHRLPVSVRGDVEAYAVTTDFVKFIEALQKKFEPKYRKPVPSHFSSAIRRALSAESSK